MTALKSVKTVALLALLASMQATGAARFDPSLQPLGSIAPIVLSNTDLTGGVTAYRPWFENGSWQGDIVQYTVTEAGAMSTSVSFAGTSPVNAGANWSALVNFAAAEIADGDYWTTGRKIITANADSQEPFRWLASSLGAANMLALDKAAVDAGAGSSAILDFVRGDRSNEYPAVTSYRGRVSILGDVVHSNPVYVGAPNDGLTDEGYATWATGLSGREPRIYVGANDGMLHVFDAADGSEVYAYVPSMLISELTRLVARPYEHTYLVDGKITIRDAYIDDQWRTVLVGTLGAGGKGIFALDVTDPDLFSEASAAADDTKVLWEKSADADADLGDSFSRAVIAKLNDDKWYALLGNGYNSVNGVAKLYLIDIETGVIKRVTTSSGGAVSPNGLSSPSLLDSTGDGRADYAYAGDIDGNLWKFDLTSDDPAEWVEAYGRPLHPGIATQPVTVAPEIAQHPGYGHLIYFGTGRLFEADDVDDASVQAMYGIWDNGQEPPLADAQSLMAQTWKGPVVFNEDAVTETVAVYNPDPGIIDWTTKHGWKAELPAGYRILTAVQLRGARVKATVTLPSTRDNYIAESYYLDGGAHPTPIYDLNADDILDDSDLVDGNEDDDTDDTSDVPMAWQRPSGVMSQLTIGRIGAGIDTLFLNYLVPPVSTACTGECDGGFQGGHIDVDTYGNSEDYGDESTKHDHEYDKKTGRVYVDAFDINVSLPAGAEAPRKEIKEHIEINAGDSGIAANEKFIVLVANADFSRGSTFHIGSKSWNVAEYQREIHVALKEWDASVAGSVPTDSDGDSLVFTWGDIAGAGGTISHNFDDVSIISGGLHPTQTGCVKSDAYKTFNDGTLVGRWRNGALTTQLIKASHFSASSAITQVDVQLPTDLVEIVQLADKSQVHLTYDFDGDDDIEESNHEVIGGLIAKSGTEHIWESTLFWHFGKLHDAVFGGKPCYGDDDWLQAIELEQNNNPVSAALDLLEIGDLDEELAANEHCKKKKEKDGGCKDYYKLLEKLEDLRDSYGDGSDDGGDEGDDDGLSADDDAPVVMGGGAEDQGVTAGPNYQFGRRSWTDVVPN